MRLNTPEQKRQVVDDATGAGAAALAVRPYVFDELGYTYVGWDNRHPLFSDPAVRRALTGLVDRESIGKELFVGLARPSNGPIPPGLWSFDPTIKPWPYDPAAAEAALDAAGWLRGEDGKRRKGGKPFSFTLSFGAGSDIQRQVAEVLQQSFGEAESTCRSSPSSGPRSRRRSTRASYRRRFSPSASTRIPTSR
jgi:ABC-type transport system substrate-binding protein